MLWPYAGRDASERPIVRRGPATRFSAEEIETMVELAQSGASSIEIGHRLNIKPQAIRARLWRMQIPLRKRVLQSRVRMMLDVSKHLHHAARLRGISPQRLIRRLLRVISRDNLFDTILPLPVPHSLGAAVTNEPPLRWHNQPPTILRRIELGGCIETPRLASCLEQPAV